MKKTPETVEALFEEALLEDDSVDNAVEDDMEDELLIHLEENREVSIFSSEYLLEGEE